MNKNKITVGILTLGCKVNQYESEAITEELARRGYTLATSDIPCDAYIVNTCTVTAEAARKSRQMVRRLRTRSPMAYIIVTGCLAQTAPKELADIAGVDAVVGNERKLGVCDELDKLIARGEHTRSCLTSVTELSDARFEAMRISAFARTRVYVKIEDGCENRCSYCTIPDARGPVRSKAPRDALEEIAALVRGGAKEIVLTGIEVASYGKDLTECDLGGLLEQVDALPEIQNGGIRVRLGSLEPSLLRPDFIERIAGLNSLAPHFHISLQSGCSKTLVAMRRKYNAERAMQVLRELRRAIPRVQFTCDVIVGFPGETDSDFEETLEFMRAARFLAAHVFPYSPRKGTPAAVMNAPVPEDEKHRRASVLSELEKNIRKDILTDAVTSHGLERVLFEAFDGQCAVGHTDSFIEVRVPSDTDLRGRYGSIYLDGIAEDPKFEYGSICTGHLI